VSCEHTPRETPLKLREEVEHLPGKLKALSSNPLPSKKKKNWEKARYSK
jgi:hypothetical protein